MLYLIKATLKNILSFTHAKREPLDSKKTVNSFDVSLLKSIPTSDFIYNSELLTLSYLEGLEVEEKNKLLLSLQKENLEVRKDNEQFRQKNFEMYLQLRKLNAANES
jgi:hypothetical protein